MTKKHFIALADVIKQNNKNWSPGGKSKPFNPDAISILADFCQSQNPRFDRQRWLDYIGKVVA